MLGGSAGVSGDVLEGRDERVEWEDIFKGKCALEAGRDSQLRRDGYIGMSWMVVWERARCERGLENCKGIRTSNADVFAPQVMRRGQE